MNESSLKRRLIISAIVSSALIPLLNTTVLGPICTSVTSDIAYPELLSNVLKYLSELIGVACVFAASACIAYSMLHKTCRLTVILISLVSPPLIYIASAIVDRSFYGSDIISASYLIFSSINCVYELLRCGVIVLVAAVVGRHALKKKRTDTIEFFSLKGTESRAAVFVSLTVFVSLILTDLTETVSLLISYGAPMNSSELVYLILPYPTSIVYSMLGYLLTCIIIKFLHKEIKDGN